MKKAIVCKKIGMTQIFAENGHLIPVTVLEAGPNVVLQKKTVEKEGYSAVQVGFLDAKEKNVVKPAKGHFEKAKVSPKKVIKELRLDDAESMEVGQEIKASVFVPGDKVDISGISKGKGYQGNIKRHGQHRGPMAHGSKYHRGVGALMAATSPGRVPKGRNLPGHMGHESVTIQNVEVVKVDADKNMILIKGAVPGANEGIVVVKSTCKVN